MDFTWTKYKKKKKVLHSVFVSSEDVFLCGLTLKWGLRFCLWSVLVLRPSVNSLTNFSSKTSKSWICLCSACYKIEWCKRITLTLKWPWLVEIRIVCMTSSVGWFLRWTNATQCNLQHFNMLLFGRMGFIKHFNTQRCYSLHWSTWSTIKGVHCWLNL